MTAELTQQQKNGLEFKRLKKLSQQGNYNRSIQSSIHHYLRDRYDISIPPFYSDYKKNLEKIFNFEAYDHAQYDELQELCKYYYLLGANKVGREQFTDENGFQQHTQRVGQYFSKHRLDPIWNSTKSKKFRAIMAKFLTEQKWFEEWQPTHLVLTVPHKDGKWKGKEIYISELIKAFRALRDQRWWKDYIHGGLYCIEVKKNNENGYHIHMHVLCFQYPEIQAELGEKDAYGKEVPIYFDRDDSMYKVKQPINYVRTRIKKSWKKIVENDTDYDGIHYSSLYYHERDENGNLLYDEVGQGFVMASDEDPDGYEDEFGNWVDPMEITRKQIRKRYIQPGDDVECWIKGVMECLKYHFKPGVLEKERSHPGARAEFDIPLIVEILNHTKGERFMSKFGKLHNHPALSLNGKKADEDIDDMVLGDAEAAQDNLINPFTGMPATAEDYVMYFTSPENILPTHDPGGGMPTIRLKSRSPVLFFEQGTTVKEAFQQYASGKFIKGVRGMNSDELAREGKYSLWPKHEIVRSETIKQKEECPF
jgi:hypothetical protein